MNRPPLHAIGSTLICGCAEAPGLLLIASTLWFASIPCAAIILLARIAAWVFD